MFYLVKTPWWMKKIYTSYEWSVQTKEKKLYLTFDDGPHPQATPFVLRQLKQYDAMATFFCIGNNVTKLPDLYKELIAGGHRVGNHTFTHLNGWRTANDVYMKDIARAAAVIDSELFRPPYGKITSFQAKHLAAAMKGKKTRVIMWDVISGDFDKKISNQQCLENVIFNAVPGSIIVFHDSEKAFPRLEFALPRVLAYFKNAGFSFDSL